MAKQKTLKDFNPMIFSQSFAEAGGREVFPNLEPAGRIEVSVSSFYGNFALAESKDSGGNHVNHMVSVCEGLRSICKSELKNLFGKIVRKGLQKCPDLERQLSREATLVLSEMRNYTHLFRYSEQEYGRTIVADAYRHKSNGRES